MIGNFVKRNIFALTIGGIAFIFVFAMNWRNNLFQTSLFRGLFTYAIFFSISYILQIIWRQEMKGNKTGNFINVTTPTEDLTELLQEIEEPKEDSSQFEPLNLEKLHVSEEKIDDVDHIIKGIRTWSQDE